MDYIIRKLFYGGGTRRLKRYFHVVYGGGRRTYGGAGRNSLLSYDVIGPIGWPIKYKGISSFTPNNFLPALHHI